MSTHATVLTLISILSLLSRCALICKDSSEIKTVRDQTKKEPKPGNTPDLSPFADVIPSDGIPAEHHSSLRYPLLYTCIQSGASLKIHEKSL